MNVDNYSYSFRIWMYSVVIATLYIFVFEVGELNPSNWFFIVDIFTTFVGLIVSFVAIVALSCLLFFIFRYANHRIYNQVDSIFTGKMYSTIVCLVLLLSHYLLLLSWLFSYKPMNNTFAVFAFTMLSLIWIIEPNLKK